MPYVWTVEYNNVDAMLPPSFSISRQGYVPAHVEPFYIRFPCTGLRSAEVHVLLQLNVTSQRPIHSDTSVSFRRNKICSKGK